MRPRRSRDRAWHHPLERVWCISIRSWLLLGSSQLRVRRLRGWIEERDCYYVLAVPETRGVYHEGCQRQARTLAKSLPQEAWFRASAGSGSKGIDSTTGLALRSPILRRR